MALPQNSPNTIPDPEGDLSYTENALKSKKDLDITKKIAIFIDNVWKQNQADFKDVRKDMVKTLKRIKGEYSAEKLAAIKSFKGSETYIRSCEGKSRAAESWIKDIYQGTDLPWSLEPTANPTLPDETVQEITERTRQQAMSIEENMRSKGIDVDVYEVADLINEYYEQQLDDAKDEMAKDAKERCKRAEETIRDQNQEGGWPKAFKEFLYYFVRLKYGVIKGPILTKKKVQTWVPDPEGGYTIQSIDQLANDVYCVCPFNFFPSKGIKDVNDGDIIEVHELSKQSLHDLIGVPGYDEDEVRAVLSEIEKGSLKKKWFTIDDETSVRKALTEIKQVAHTKPPTDNANNNKSDVIWAQEFYGTVNGKMLLEWGMDIELDPEADYQVNCWKIGPHVIKAVLNPDSLGRKPYHISSWAKNPEWVVGEGLVEFSAPIEDAMNAIVRALINNIAIASGPMAEIDKDRVDLKTPIYPWRQIESTSMQMRNDGPAVNYYQPQMHAQELIAAWQFFSKVLDEMTVPAYAQGASQSGVTAGTATVFTQLLAAASRSIKAVVANIDDDIISPYVQMCYDYNMKFTHDKEIKGDATIVAKGVNALLVKEQQAQRKVEYLQIVANPAFMQILGQKNVASVLAQIAKANDIDLPDMNRLDGGKDAEMQLEQMLMAQAGVDPMQMNGQVANGGGSPANAQGMNPDGSKAGVNNG